MARANSVIENGRLAIQLIESDLVHAGFWDTFVPQFDDQTVRRRTTRRSNRGARSLPDVQPGLLERGVYHAT